MVTFSALNFITSPNFTAATSKCNDLVAIKQSIVIKATFPNLELFKEGKEAKRKFPWHSEQDTNVKPTRNADSLHRNDKKNGEKIKMLNFMFPLFFTASFPVFLEMQNASVSIIMSYNSQFSLTIHISLTHSDTYLAVNTK